MTTAWVPLATTTLSSSASSVTFGSIPSGYRDLVCIINGNGSGTFEVYPVFNGDTTAANYPAVLMAGTGSGSGSSATINRWIGYFLAGNNQTITHRIFDYSATDKHKTALYNDDRPTSLTLRGAMRWTNSSAITSLGYLAQVGTFSVGTTFSLYGSNRL